jgi:hypothetical protein
LEAEDLEERGREGSVAAAVAPLYRGDAAVVRHGARTLLSWGTTLGLLTLWGTALEFLPSCPTAAGI